MKKEIEDYLHLYVGQHMVVIGSMEGFEEPLPVGTLVRLNCVNKGDIQLYMNDGDAENWNIGVEHGNGMYAHWFNNTDFKLVLRPLSDMTEEELGEWAKIAGADFDEKELKRQHKAFVTLVEQKGINAFEVGKGEFHLVPKMFVFLLSKGFDLFGLIDAGIAIDIKTIK